MGEKYRYIIVGAGLAGASAVEGIREIDGAGVILMLSFERRLPYNRPPLSKKLWWGGTKLQNIFIHDDTHYYKNRVELLRGTLAISVDPARKIVTDQHGTEYGYEKLLLATGAEPNMLPLPGANHQAIRYYRYLDDYTAARERVSEGKSATIIGGGFIGSEMAASLARDRVKVTMLFPEQFIFGRIFPEYLAGAVQKVFLENGVTILNENEPVSFTKDGDGLITVAANGNMIASHLVVVGTGIVPSTKLAEYAGLETGDGIVINEYLQTSEADIFAAGDNASCAYPGLPGRMRFDHWDNARSQGILAGKNMAGAGEPFTRLPEFSTEVFNLSFKAVGELQAGYRTIADWQEEKLTGTIYYLNNKRVVGVLFCNSAGDPEEARRIIRSGEVPERLQAEVAT